MVEPAASVENSGTAEITPPTSADNEGGVWVGDKSALFPSVEKDLFNTNTPIFLNLWGAGKRRLERFNQDGDKMWKKLPSLQLSRRGAGISPLCGVRRDGGREDGTHTHRHTYDCNRFEPVSRV